MGDILDGGYLRRGAVMPQMRSNVSPLLSGAVPSAPAPPSMGAAAAGSASAAAARTGSIMDSVGTTQVSVGSVILIVLAALLLFFVVYKVWDVIRKTSLRRIFIEKGTVSTSTPKDLGAGKTIPDPIAGREYSVSFWFWLDGSDADASAKTLLRMGSSYDFKIRRHELVFKILAVPGMAEPAEVVVPIAIQKWTHIVMVIDNNYATLYKDGDVVASRNVAGHLHALPRTYDVGVSNPVKGYIAGVRYFNHVANAKDVRKAYRSGPTSAGLLRYLGLPMYGVRNPFYRIDHVSEVQR